jgi:hypothetical protein
MNQGLVSLRNDSPEPPKCSVLQKWQKDFSAGSSSTDTHFYRVCKGKLDPLTFI